MSRPRVLKIQGRRVKIVFKTPIISSDGHTCMGLCHYDENMLEIDPSLAPDEVRSTALHEVVHDVESQMGLLLTEAQVTCFSSALFAVIRDNPTFFKWLQETE